VDRPGDQNRRAAHGDAVAPPENLPTNNFLVAIHGGFCSGFHPERGFFAVGAELWSIVFDIEPDLAMSSCGVLAAGCAAKAGCGEAKDQPPLDEAAKTRLRAQSRKWLQGNIADGAKREKKHARDFSSFAIKELYLSVLHSCFISCVRYPAPLSKLPEVERKAWEGLWDGYDEDRSVEAK
jgi:hypothetical protein